jgi:hypothetical protein
MTLEATPLPCRAAARSAAVWLGAAALAAALAAGCASVPSRIEKFSPALPGSWSTMSVTSTGSFGSGTEQVRTTIGQRTWEGRAVIAQETAGGAMLLEPADGRRIGFVDASGRTLWKLDPPVGFRYPMEVGQAWTVTSTMTLTTPQGPRQIPVSSQWKVVAIEDVTVPAGTFRALKVSVVDTMNDRVWNDDTYWVDVARQFGVKTQQVRPASHPQGAGTRESVLVANDIRR